MNTSYAFATDPETNASLVPAEMVVAARAILPYVIDIMSLWGVERIESNIARVGQLLLPQPRIRSTTKVEVPKWVLDGRRLAMYHFGWFLLLNGISAVEIEPTAEELAQIVARWRACEQSLIPKEEKDKKDGEGIAAATPAVSPAGGPEVPGGQ